MKKFIFWILLFSLLIHLLYNEIKEAYDTDKTASTIITHTDSVSVKKSIIPKDTVKNKVVVIDTTKIKVIIDTVKNKYLDKLFSNGSAEYADSKIDDLNEYDLITKDLKSVLYNNFSINQLKCIKNIRLINWKNLNNNISGITKGTENHFNNTIYLPILAEEYIENMLHEVWHCIYFAHYSQFNRKYKKDWNSIDTYVSEYAKTNIYEDVAETGKFYSIKTGKLYDLENIKDNKKFEIINNFYKDTE